MYAIRVVGPSGFVQYLNATSVPLLSGLACDAATFKNEEDAQYRIDEMALTVTFGRIVEVTDLENKS